MTKWDFKINKKTKQFFIKGYKSFSMFSYQIDYPIEHLKFLDGSLYELLPQEYFVSINLWKSTITIRVRSSWVETKNNIYICGEII